MVESSRRHGQSRPVMSNHNRCWIWGRNVVLETLRSGRWPILELLVSDRAVESLRNEAFDLAGRKGIAVAAASDAFLTKSCRSDEHQGFAARMTPFPCLPFNHFLQRLAPRATVALLDRLQDPFNVGAIIRSASTLGVDGILVGDKAQSAINSQVARSSAGAVNHLPIGQTDDLGRALEQFQSLGFQVVAASEKADRPVYEADFRKATVIVIGNEGRGIDPELLARCDLSVSIPMSGQVGSLNAAVAAGILFYEIRRQRVASPSTR